VPEGIVKLLWLPLRAIEYVWEGMCESVYVRGYL